VLVEAEILSRGNSRWVEWEEVSRAAPGRVFQVDEMVKSTAQGRKSLADSCGKQVACSGRRMRLGDKAAF
jgi:hypothetical protein